MAQEEVKFPEGSRVIPIHPLSKYVVILPKDTSEERIEMAADFLDSWWDSGNPFLIMTDEIVLVNVGKADIIEEES